MDGSVAEESPFSANQSDAQCLEHVQQQVIGQDDDALSDEECFDTESDDKTDKIGKKPARNVHGKNGRRRPAKQRLISRTMSEWQDKCRQLKLPTESQEFCDFVLVFDEIVADDIDEAKNRTGCCNCCQKSSKELEKCLKVG